MSIYSVLSLGAIVYLLILCFYSTTAASPSPVPPTKEVLCELYSGETCSSYLHNQSVFVAPELTLDLVEEQLKSAYGVIKESRLVFVFCPLLLIDPRQSSIRQTNPPPPFPTQRHAAALQQLRTPFALLLRPADLPDTGSDKCQVPEVEAAAAETTTGTGQYETQEEEE